MMKKPLGEVTKYEWSAFKTGIVMTKYWNFILLVAPVVLVIVLLIVLPEIITNYAFIFVPMVALGMVIGALLVRGR